MIVDDLDSAVLIGEVFDLTGKVDVEVVVEVVEEWVVVWCVAHTYIVQCGAGKATDAWDFSDILLKKDPPP